MPEGYFMFFRLLLSTYDSTNGASHLCRWQKLEVRESYLRVPRLEPVSSFNQVKEQWPGYGDKLTSCLVILVIALSLLQLHEIPAHAQSDTGCSAICMPHRPLGGIVFSAENFVQEPVNKVVVPACESVRIAPELIPRVEDIGKKAALFMYISVPEMNDGFLLQKSTDSLSEIQEIDFWDGPVDFSALEGLNAVIYYGYQLPDTGELVYNAYSVEVVHSFASDYEPPVGSGTVDRPGGGGVGPWALRLRIATSEDGLSFEKTDRILTDQADVSDLAVDDRGWIYAYYVGWTMGDVTNKIGVAISFDDGLHWVYKYVNIEGASGNIPPVDPDVVILPDGTFRMYVTYSSDNAGNERGDGGPHTYYAEGANGIDFQMKGRSFGEGGAVFDPTVAKIGDTWHLYAWDLHGTSNDGREFAPERQLKLRTSDGKGVIIANIITVNDGCRAYCYDPMSKDSIYSFLTTDGNTWSEEEGTRLDLEEGELESEMVKEPAVAKLANGSYLMLYSTKIP